LRITFVIGENVASGFVLAGARGSRARPAFAKFSFDSCRKFIELSTGKLRFGEPPEPAYEPRALPRLARKKFFAASDFPFIFASSASDV
jgi:hypothetical protein